MKKTYIAPDVLIVEIETQFVIADSLRLGIDTTSTAEGDASVGVGGSRSNLWGED